MLCLRWARLDVNLDPSRVHWAQLASKRVQFVPWTQLGSGANWPEFVASYAQVGPKWAPVRPNLRLGTAKFEFSWLLVGPSRPASFLSPYCLGTGGSRREATRINP